MSGTCPRKTRRGAPSFGAEGRAADRGGVSEDSGRFASNPSHLSRGNDAADADRATTASGPASYSTDGSSPSSGGGPLPPPVLPPPTQPSGLPNPRDLATRREGDEDNFGTDDVLGTERDESSRVMAKDGDNVFSSTVRVQVIKRWHDCVHKRAERHGTRGKAKQLHLNNVARHLAEKGSFIKDSAIDMRACARFIDNSIKFQERCNAIRVQSTGMSEEGV